MPPSSVYQEYRSDLDGPKTITSARTGVLVVIGLNTAFLPLDYWSNSERFNHLAAVRLAWDAAMLAVFWALNGPNPLRTMLAGLYLTGAGMLAVIALAGPITSSYWAGMMILFLGIPVILPLSTRQAALVVGLLATGFVGIAVFVDGDQPLRAFLAPTFFVFGAGVECVASTMLLEKLRLSDFERRREIEAARDHLKELDDAKSRFTANVHHELRTPLTLTLAPLESLLAGEFGPVSDLQAEYLKTMHVNALRLLGLINDLLSLAKIEGKQLELNRAPIVIGDVVAGIVESARPMAERKEILLTFEGDRSSVVNADPSTVEKVVINVLGNALKFTEPRGAIRVSVTSEAGGVGISVTDNGIGLQDKDCERIFDRFAQADASSTRKHEGTGIGLSLCKELIDLHGGSISAKSAGPGTGTTVKAWLPPGECDGRDEQLLVDDESVAIPRTAGPQPVSAPATGTTSVEGSQIFENAIDRWERSSKGREGAVSRPRRPGVPEIVVCEDNPDMRRLLFHVLEPEFDVRLAENGRDGLAAVRERKPDLILTDAMMPEMSGTELCREVKSDPTLAMIPVVLVTSKADREMKVAGLEMGADDYVTKPFHSRELLARVRALVKVRTLQGELAERNRRLEDANAEIAKAMEDLKGAEAQLVLTERLAAIGELAAGIAHEANNPVNFALNAARSLRSYIQDVQNVAGELDAALRSETSEELLTRLTKEGISERFGDLSSVVAELAEIIEEGLSRTGKLVGDLRDFAAPQAGRRSLADLPDVFESSRQLLRHSLQENGVSIERVDVSDVPLVSIDAQAIGQVFLNILKNAAEAFDGRDGSIRVVFSECDSGVLVEIADNGPGILEENLGRLFEPFFTTKEPGRGTGLGLSISRQVVEEHGGRISVQSEIGRGSSFTIWLPAGEQYEA